MATDVPTFSTYMYNALVTWVEIITPFVPGVVGRLTDGKLFGSAREANTEYCHRMGREERYTSERGRLAADTMQLVVAVACAEYGSRRTCLVRSRIGPSWQYDVQRLRIAHLSVGLEHDPGHVH